MNLVMTCTGCGAQMTTDEPFLHEPDCPTCQMWQTRKEEDDVDAS